MTWRLSPKEGLDEPLLPFPQAPIETKLNPKENILNLKFINHQFQLAEPIINSEIFIDSSKRLERNPDDETLYEIKFSYVHPVSKRIMQEVYTVMGRAITDSVLNIDDITTLQGGTPTFTLSILIEDYEIVYGDYEPEE